MKGVGPAEKIVKVGLSFLPYADCISIGFSLIGGNGIDAMEAAGCAADLLTAGTGGRVVDASRAVEGAVDASRATDAARASDELLGMSDEAADIAKASDDVPLSCPLHSFAAGTDVIMADGTRKDINTITPGEWVLATDPNTGTTQPREVTTTYQHNDTGLIQLTITNGTTTSTITATGWHPIWSDTRHDWINIADLQPGEQLHTGTNQPAWVLTTTPVHGTQPMYDLTIHTTHTYYIHTNDQPLLVHNNTPGDPTDCTGSFPGDDAVNKVPAEWGPGMPTNKGEGVRWTDPSNPGNGTRIDRGNPLNSQPTQRVDHVVVRSEGQVLGRSGSPIVGSIKANAVEAHIPLNEWLTWQAWNLL